MSQALAEEQLNDLVNSNLLTYVGPGKKIVNIANSTDTNSIFSSANGNYIPNEKTPCTLTGTGDSGKLLCLINPTGIVDNSLLNTPTRTSASILNYMISGSNSIGYGYNVEKRVGSQAPDQVLQIQPPRMKVPTTITIVDDMGNYVLTPETQKAPFFNTKCQLRNYGSKEYPKIECNIPTQLGEKPILPKDCEPINTGTLLKPSIQCQYPISSPSTSSNSTNTTITTITTNIANIDDTSILSLNKKNLVQNPYLKDITKMNNNIRYKCPTGFTPQYPNITFTSCSNTGTPSTSCQSSFDSPKLLNNPCVGKANINYNYKGTVNGAINTKQDFKCEYGKPVFNGTEINGNFIGDVMCLYQLDTNK